MKYPVYFLIIILSILLTSCGWMCEKGSGNIFVRKYTLESFQSVVVQICGKVFIKQGATESLEVETDDNILNQLRAYIVNNTLYIESNTAICPTKLNFYITMKDISKIELDGSGRIMNIDSIFADRINFIMNGSGEIEIYGINANVISANINGSGNIRFSGKANEARLEINSSGNIDALELPSNRVYSIINGSGNIKIYALNYLFARINGSGNIYYRGDPAEIDTKITGSGELIHLQ